MSETCVCCGREIPEGRMTCMTCERLESAGYYYEPKLKTMFSPEEYGYQLHLYSEVFGMPFRLQKPTNPINPYTPYPSKYFIDRRFEKAEKRDLTADDIYEVMKKLKER